MNEGVLEQIVASIESAFILAGAKDFEDGLKIAKKLIGFFHEALQGINTRADLKAAFAASEITVAAELAKAEFLMQHLPSVARYYLANIAEQFASDFPPLPAGRPHAIPSHLCLEVLDSIAELNRRGCTLSVAKERAAKRYGVSRTSIDRLWARRGDYVNGAESLKVTMAEALQYLKTGE